ncbi:MAG: hypothetical protein Q4G04_00775 [bacterium]|nr:hypothetical protein [bacterium]
MNSVKDFLNKYKLELNRYTQKKDVRILDTNKGKYVIKKKKNNNIDAVYNYLKSRAFNYYPDKIINDPEYDVFEYISDYDEPSEQKILDLVKLMAMLHSKTTFYKEVDIDDYKKIYEDLLKNIEYLYNYYTDIINIIESEVYMSPVSYLIARNINIIYESIDYSKKTLEKWYKLIKDKRRQRVVNIHNNLELEHYIKNDKSYFISWEKSKIDMPIYDIYVLYKKHYLDFDFNEIFKYYESIYPLMEEEKLLLFVILCIPDKISLTGSQYELCKKVRKSIDYLYKTLALISENSITS